MKTVREKYLPDGSRELVVRLDKNETLIPIRSDAHYSLGEPLDDFIVPAHVLESMLSAHWCCVEQKWVT